MADGGRLVKDIPFNGAPETQKSLGNGPQGAHMR